VSVDVTVDSAAIYSVVPGALLGSIGALCEAALAPEIRFRPEISRPYYRAESALQGSSSSSPRRTVRIGHYSGGGGNRTLVRKSLPERVYMRIR